MLIPSLAVSAAMAMSSFDVWLLVFLAVGGLLLVWLLITGLGVREILYHLIAGVFAGALVWLGVLAAGGANDIGRRLLGLCIIIWLAGRLIVRMSQRNGATR